jgi:para-aminobenzoate synthetase component 1
MGIAEFTGQLNAWGKQKTPFLFVVDFEQEKPFACRLDDANANDLLFDIRGFSNAAQEKVDGLASLTKFPISLGEYQKKFDAVSGHLKYGDSFLTNLTIKTEIQTNQTLRELFFLAKAKYKLLWNNKFLVFSPETFVRTREGYIYTFPMKGTIDAALPDAKETLLGNPKELAEHVTIVDLMRNDLSRVASRVAVTRFRYIDELKTNYKNLLQVSSEIAGQLSPGYATQLGTLLANLLPAGSVTGAPKMKTMQIIREAEQEKRGYYAGIFGYFDGRDLDTAVMIRFIEKEGDKLFYRSGGGITTQSAAETEYQEAIDKIYVPVD